MLRASGVGFISRDGLPGSWGTTVGIALGQAGRPGFSQSSGQEQLREGYLRQHPHTPAQASLRRRWALALRARAEAARGGWVHLVVLLGTTRALSH